MSTKKNMGLLYGMALLTNLMPAYVIERLFWASRGMSVGMVVACEIVYAVVIIALEVPSGVLADVLGRRTLLRVGALMTAVEFGMLLFAHHFWQFALAIGLTAIGSAAVSGTMNAMLYDTLALAGQTERFSRVLGRMRAIEAIGTLVAALAGSVLADQFGLAVPYAVSFGSAALAVLLSMLLTEPPRVMASEARMRVRDVLRQASRFFRRLPDVRTVMLHATVIAACIIYADEFWQLYLEADGFPVLAFGLVLAGLSLIRMAGAVLAERLCKWLGTRRAQFALSAVAAAGLLGAAAGHGLAGVILLGFAVSASEAMQVIAMDYLHHRADDASRATTESLVSLLQRAFVIVVGLVFAAIVERVSLVTGFGALGLLCVLATIVFAAAYRRRGV